MRNFIILSFYTYVRGVFIVPPRYLNYRWLSHWTLIYFRNLNKLDGRNLLPDYFTLGSGKIEGRKRKKLNCPTK